MKHIKPTRQSRLQKCMQAFGRPGRMHDLTLTAVLVACCALTTSSLRADTIFLKDGRQIPDCEVTAETEDYVTVRTPVGDMMVPRTEIYRIVKQRTVRDIYTEQLSRIREGDVNGLFKLAQWCRTAQGLRKESDELLAKVISLKENHVGARRLLGHVNVRGEWVVPSPLWLQLEVGATSGASESDLRTKLELFLSTRKDVRLASEPVAGDPLDACTLHASVVAAQKAAGTFYGLKIGRPSFAATVNLSAQSPWIKGTTLKLGLTGLVPATDGNVALAIQNAFGSNSVNLHRFLDRVLELRSKRLEVELRKKERQKVAGRGTEPDA